MRPSRLVTAAVAILIVGGIAWWIAFPKRESSATVSGTTDSRGTAPTAPDGRSEAAAKAAIQPKPAAPEPSDDEPPASGVESRGRVVRVLVVDEAEVPQAGVPVALIDQDYSRSVERGTTGRDGIAKITPPSTRQPASHLPDEPPPMQVAIALPVAPRVSTTFEPEGVEETPIKLVLPPTCGVSVSLVKADGSPFEDPATVSAELGSVPGSDSLPSAIHKLEAVPTNGRVHFPRIGLGGDLAVRALPKDPALRTVEATVPAPRAEGVQIPVTLVCGGPALIVTGRLVTPEKAAIANAAIRADLNDESQDLRSGQSWAQAVTDAAGRFTLRFDIDASGLSSSELRLEIPDTEARGVAVGARPTRRASLRLPGSAVAGKAELGDVVVAGPALIAAGRVVNEDGGPIQDALIWVLRQEGAGWRLRDEFDEVLGKSDADGRFEVRGPVAGGKLALSSVLQGWICRAPVPIERGTRNVEIVMTGAGGLAGSIAGLGESSPFGRPAVSVVVAGSALARAARIFTREHPDGVEIDLDRGEFNTWELLPGTYSVRFLGAGAPKPLLVVENVVVSAGELNRDPRLQNVDLGALLKPRVITVLDEERKPLIETPIGARATNDPSGGFTGFKTGSDGKAVVVMPAGPIEIVVARGGYFSAILPSVTDDVTVTLTRATPRTVAIRLADGVAPPTAPFRIRAELRMLASPGQARPKSPVPGDPRNSPAGNDTVALARSGVLTVDEPGLYEVRLYLNVNRPSYGYSERLAQAGGNATVTVGADGEASVTVTPDPDALKRAIEREKDR